MRATQRVYNRYMGIVKQHYMIKMKRGEFHPIFNLKYLAENIASLVETLVLFAESGFLLIFLLNFFINVFDKYTVNFVPAILLNAVSVQLFALFNLGSNQDSNFIALLISILVYYLTHKYFEFVKYNLHPKKTRAKSSLESFPE